MIAVDKKGERWENRPGQGHQVTGDFAKVGAKVTVEYTMTANKVEVKEEKKKEDKKKK